MLTRLTCRPTPTHPPGMVRRDSDNARPIPIQAPRIPRRARPHAARPFLPAPLPLGPLHLEPRLALVHLAAVDRGPARSRKDRAGFGPARSKAQTPRLVAQRPRRLDRSAFYPRPGSRFHLSVLVRVHHPPLYTLAALADFAPRPRDDGRSRRHPPDTLDRRRLCEVCAPRTSVLCVREEGAHVQAEGDRGDSPCAGEGHRLAVRRRARRRRVRSVDRGRLCWMQVVRMSETIGVSDERLPCCGRAKTVPGPPAVQTCFRTEGCAVSLDASLRSSRRDDSLCSCAIAARLALQSRNLVPDLVASRPYRMRPQRLHDRASTYNTRHWRRRRVALCFMDRPCPDNVRRTSSWFGEPSFFYRNSPQPT